MANAPEAEQVAAALRLSVGLLLRRLRQATVDGELTLPESSALARLDRGGASTASALAKLEQISPQSMGATLAALRRRGLIERRPDPGDGRQVLLTVTDAGLQVLHDRRSARVAQMAQALASGFTRAELEQLMRAAPLIE